MLSFLKKAMRRKRINPIEVYQLLKIYTKVS